MKILFVVPYVPSLIRVRPYNVLKALAQRGHVITLLTVYASAEEQAELEQLRPYCQQIQALPMPLWRSLVNCLGEVLSGRPFQAVYSYRADLFKGVDISSFDVAHVEHLRGSRYALDLQSQLPVVWDSVDCITHLFEQATAQTQADPIRRLRSQMDLARTRQYEAWLPAQFSRTLITSQKDKEAMLGLPNTTAVAKQIDVLPNGVDLAYFQPNEAIRREPQTLVLTGKMSYHANIAMTKHLVEEIMPIVWAEKPEVQVYIVGKDPTPDLVAFAETYSQVTVTGFVEDLRPYLQRATLAVAPLTYGAGIQNKVLEAMACATPVITVPRAVNALQLEVGKDVVVAEVGRPFAQAICHLLDQPQERAMIAQNGYQYVQTNHNWDMIAQKLERIYQEVSTR